ncbi:MAG: rhodanese [Methylococcaceae bacterium]|nr:rhodanese [Methylococcaceae bacterium]
MSIIQISAKQLHKKIQGDVKPLLLDVREHNEFEFASIEGSQHIPMNQIPLRIQDIDASKECVVICHHGIRSQQVADYLVHSGLTGIYNLSGGIDAWSVECDNTVSRY